MSEPLNTEDLVMPEYRTSEKASKINEVLVAKLGTPIYGPARLAIALSLAEKKPVKPAADTRGATSVRGRYLFSNPSIAAWVSLFTQHANRELSKDDFRAAVAAHWARGLSILEKLWKASEGDFDKFMKSLAAKAGLQHIDLQPNGNDENSVLEPQELLEPSAINLHIGKLLTGKSKGDSLQWCMNEAGHAPHIAIMGASGGGKSHLAFDFVENIHNASNCATIIFDMKGDIADNSGLRSQVNASIIRCSEQPIPLDILHLEDRKKNTAVQNTAMGFCHSLGCVVKRGIGQMQMEILRKETAESIRENEQVSITDLHESVLEEYQENNRKEDSVIAALTQVRDFNLFVPELNPDKFFSRSWIFSLNGLAVEIQRFTSLMILEALQRHFEGQKEAPMDSSNNRQVSKLLVIDEAHKILGFKSALGDILRISRSKGGAVMLISQSPKDYVKSDINFLENMGLVACYRTSATPASIKNVFSKKVSVSDLEKGQCMVGTPSEPQKIKIW